MITLPDRVVGTEPDSTHLAYAEPNGDRWDVVVIDVTDSRELARTTAIGGNWGGWEAPRTVLDGSLVWTHVDDGWVEVNWETGEQRQLPGTAEGVYELAGGRYAVQGKQLWTVRSTSDGALLQTIATTPDTYAFFSPDGRYLRFWDQSSPYDQEPFLLDVETGERVDLPREMRLATFQWAPNGELIVIHEKSRTVETCEPASAQCRPVDMSLADGDIWHSEQTAED